MAHMGLRARWAQRPCGTGACRSCQVGAIEDQIFARTPTRPPPTAAELAYTSVREIFEKHIFGRCLAWSPMALALALVGCFDENGFCAGVAVAVALVAVSGVWRSGRGDKRAIILRKALRSSIERIVAHLLIASLGLRSCPFRTSRLFSDPRNRLQ